MRRELSRFFLYFLNFFLAVTLFFSEQWIIKGKIFDKNTKKPLPAYVMILETSEGIDASEDGSFEIKTVVEECTLLVHMVGYKIKEIKVRKGDFLNILLEPEPISSHEVVVTADARVSEDRSQRTVTLSMLDVYRTPGAAADPAYAAQILPGVNSIPDASNLLIRGGAPDEVGYYLDGIEIKHPYQSESLKEGYFSIFDNQIIQNLTVSTSGFSPKFGDALSGIMDITTKDTVTKNQFSLGISILGVNFSSAISLSKKASFIGTFNAGHSRLMTEINGQEGRVFKNGESVGKLIFKLKESSNLKFLYLLHGYNFFHEIENFKVRTSNKIFGLTFENIHSKNLFSKITLSSVDYKSSYIFPQFSFKIEDSFLQGRVDLTLDLKEHLIEGGIDFQRRDNNFIEKISGQTFNVKGGRGGFYLQDRFRIYGNLFATAGIRSSALELSKWRLNFEPRFSIAYIHSKEHIFRFSAGAYNQFGDYFVIKENPDLKPKSSYHFSLSYDFIKNKDMLRITLYEKKYKNLFLFEENSVKNGGEGYARGAEFFLKKEREWFDFKIVYNFLNSKRKENETLILARSPYEIDHSFTLILNLKRKMDSIGIRWSYASGLPYTPLLGREWDSENLKYKPIWGEPYSERYSPFRRVDISLSKNLNISNKFVLLYLGVMNIFNHKNTLRYEWNEEYSSQTTVGSIFARSFFIGIFSMF